MVHLEPRNHLEFDFRAEATRHYAAIGIDVPHFEEWLRWCQIHIGLVGQAYMACVGNWIGLQETTQHTLDVAT